MTRMPVLGAVLSLLWCPCYAMSVSMSPTMMSVSAAVLTVHSSMASHGRHVITQWSLVLSTLVLVALLLVPVAGTSTY